MKLLLFLSTLFLAAFSQRIALFSPPTGTEVSPGQDVTVQLVFGNSLTGVQHLNLVISMLDCAGTACPTDAGSGLETPLFVGNFTPVFQSGNLPPYENFTVTIPETLSTGTNMITVAHSLLVGVSEMPIVQYTNVTVSTP
ncbi:hypothetical protein BT96DRAFT_927632 [Gymnopus androsaceus JB14]|uniref:Phosphatidylglycerol/phosphatidylinositol transfer protein n=1 Tax=Gymnopus androsaceus JB14 TaxID=1447944 RepID=A0A6A4GNQ5_9AGAR|nr:hypothetical protein BT96DRAFT_927632 [Gymnopus androsaceus JB14]